MAITAVIRLDQGILESLHLFEDRKEALRFGQAQFEELTGGKSTLAQAHDITASEMLEDEPDYDARWGGIARGYIMHWSTDDDDVWVAEPEETGAFSLLSPEMLAAIGRHTIEAAAEEVVNA